MQKIDYFEERELKLNQLKLIVAVVLIISIGMIAYTISWFVNYENKYGFFHQVTATIIEHKELDGDTHDVLSYIVDGNEFIVTSTYISKNEIGDTITIYYDENNPLGVIYSKDAKLYSLPIVSGIFLLCSIGLLVVYVLFARTIKRDKRLIALAMADELEQLEQIDNEENSIESKTKDTDGKSSVKKKNKNQL